MTPLTRCAQRRITLHSATFDGFSDEAATTLQVARFPAGHTTICDCLASGGKINEADCAGLTVSDSAGKEVARFSGAQFKAKQSLDGGIIIFRIPVSQRKLTEVQDNARRIHQLNLEHERFYRRGPIA
jgi:hypothetical protein